MLSCFIRFIMIKTVDKIDFTSHIAHNASRVSVRLSTHEYIPFDIWIIITYFGKSKTKELKMAELRNDFQCINSLNGKR